MQSGAWRVQKKWTVANHEAPDLEYSHVGTYAQFRDYYSTDDCQTILEVSDVDQSTMDLRCK